MKVQEVLDKYKAQDEEREQMRVDDNVQMSVDQDTTKRLKSEELAKVIGEDDVDYV